VVVVIAAVAAVALAAHSRQEASARRHALAHAQARAAAARAAAARAASAARVQANVAAAAAWIATQVGARVRVGCDPSACSAVQSAGHPASDEVTLRPGSRLPGVNSLVVATPIVRADYQLADGGLPGGAPAVIVSFGTGPDAVTVREVEHGGRQAYDRAAARARAARRAAGKRLLRSKAHGGAAASGRTAVTAELAEGLVDQRLIGVLTRLAARYPVRIVGFADGGRRAAAPYRQAEITVPRSVRGKLGELTRMEKLLRRELTADPARLTVTQVPGDRRGLEIWFPAPSPF